MLRFDGRVAIVTGAAGALGRSYARLLAGRGASVIVNDLGTAPETSGSDVSPAARLTAEIRNAGGVAVPNGDSVEAGDRIVECALDTFGRVDIVINNAGILRDASFHKMQDVQWDEIQAVHLRGAYKVTRAAWPHMRKQEFGRVVMTTSAVGLYGNFGQANYSAAKLGVLGLANTLAIEGMKHNIVVNTIAPIAGSRLSAGFLPAALLDALTPDNVSPLVAYLCHEDTTDTGGVFEVGAGWIAKLRWQRTRGTVFHKSDNLSVDAIAARWQDINDWKGAQAPTTVQESLDVVWRARGLTENQEA